MIKKFLFIFFVIAIAIIFGVFYAVKKYEYNRPLLMDSLVKKETKSLYKKEPEQNIDEFAKNREIENINNFEEKQIKKNDELGSFSHEYYNLYSKKVKKENEIKEIINSTIKKPFNYKVGIGCEITICNKKTGLFYKIHDCESDALFKRQIEIALDSYISKVKNTNFSEFKCFDDKYKDDLVLNFSVF